MEDKISRKQAIAAMQEIKEALIIKGDPILAGTMNTPIKRLEQLPGVTNWTKTSDRTPQEFISVIVYVPGDNPLPTVMEAYLAKDCWVTKTAILRKSEVTHWAPMPEPPEG